GGADGCVGALPLVPAPGRQVDRPRVPLADAVDLRASVQPARAGRSRRVPGRSQRRQQMRLAAAALVATVSFVNVLGAPTGSGAWRTYGQNLQGWRYSELAQIDTRNVARLSPRWIYQIRTGGGFETTPLVFDGMMFIAGPSNNSWALDVLTGRPIWHYRKT